MRLEDLPEIDIMNPARFDDLPGLLDWSAYPDGLARSRRGLEILSYPLVSEAFRSTDLRNSSIAKMAAVGFTEGTVFDTLTGMTTSTEGADHKRMRRAFQPWFIADNVEKFRTEIAATVDRWLVDNSEGTVDFANELGARLPSMVFAQLVGADLEDEPFITRVSADILKFASHNPEFHDVIESSVLETIDWLDALIERKTEQPGSDLTSALLQAEKDQTITRDHTVRILVTLIIASVDSTRGQMSCNLVALADNKDQWRLLKEHPEAAANAVTELYRYNSSVLAMSRYSETPIEMFGLEIEAYQPVFLDVFAANNDPQAYDEPRRLDLLSVRPRAAFSFGNGRHSCVGRMVATIEQEELLKGLLRHWDDFDVEHKQFVGMPFVQGPGSLTLSVTPRA